jgi:hypothetical protein
MIGGSATFDASWLGTRLEALLPVTFATYPGVSGLDRPFRLQLTQEALRHPLFQIADDRSVQAVWSQIPPYVRYGRVDAAKPGAQVWIEHPQDEGPNGRRILMAAQRFGAGVSAVICIPNLWRWRLARDSDAREFDRFWQQLFRFLSASSRQDVTIRLADQDLHPEMDVELSLEQQPRPTDLPGTQSDFSVHVANESQETVLETTVTLAPAQPAPLRFRAEKPGLYTVSVLTSQQVLAASRTVEIPDVNLEFQQTRRNMETLRQWASLSDGLALKLEQCEDGGQLVDQIEARIEQARHSNPIRRPAGLNAVMLTLLLACLAAEWLCRKRWRLI